MICAAEDVGNADPQALVVAVNAALAAERIGLPAANIILSQAVTYVTTAPKSNAEMFIRDRHNIRYTGLFITHSVIFDISY